MTTNQRLTSVSYLLKVLVSPLKTFKEIAQNPNATGLIVMFALFLAASVASMYVSASKIILTINNQPISLLASNMFSGFMLSSSVQTGMALFVTWFVYAGLLFLLMRVFGEKGDHWLPFFMLVGYVFSVFIIRTVVTTVLISTLPDLHLGFSTWPPATSADYTAYLNEFNAVWARTFASQATSVVFYIVYGWFVILGCIALHASREISWGRAMMVSLTALLAILTLSVLLPVGLFL